MGKCKNKELIKTLKWIKKYRGFWELICTPDNENMNIGKMKKLIDHLYEHKQYELILVTMMVHRNEGYMKEMKEYMKDDLIKLEIQNNGFARIHKLLMQYLD